MLYILAILSTLIISLVSLIGVFTLSIKEDVIRKYIFLFISLAAGALLGDAFIHLIPESFESFENGSYVGLMIILGILIFFVMEKILHWHHHGEEHATDKLKPSVGKLILFSDGVHNFIDGIIIGVSFLASIPVGVATTIAVVLHEIPQEIGDFAILLHSGYTRRKALLYNFLSALTAVFGTVFAFIIGASGEGLVKYFLPIAAGGFIYIAVADLIPEMHRTKKITHSVLQLLSLSVGIISMLALLYLE